jgi:hypothetical protein
LLRLFFFGALNSAGGSTEHYCKNSGLGILFSIQLCNMAMVGPGRAITRNLAQDGVHLRTSASTKLHILVLRGEIAVF